LFVKNCVSFGLVWGIGGKFAYFFHFYHVGVSVVVGIVVFPAMVASIGVNYGQIANNLPLPQNVVPLVKTIGATKVKLYRQQGRTHVFTWGDHGPSKKF
jgi:hypothetical protein